MHFRWPWAKKPQNNWLVLVLSIAIAELAGVIGSLATIPAIPSWYAYLAKPSFNPPNWLFGPVWTLLYALMGTAAYLVWREHSKNKSAKHFFQLYFIQLVLNIAWSLVFFGLHDLLLAFVVIIFLWTFIAQMLRATYELKLKSATYLLWPYLAWVTFAAILNLAILLLN
jgi:tryptophan-rich sensory protein